MHSRLWSATEHILLIFIKVMCCRHGSIKGRVKFSMLVGSVEQAHANSCLRPCIGTLLEVSEEAGPEEQKEYIVGQSLAHINLDGYFSKISKRARP